MNPPLWPRRVSVPDLSRRSRCGRCRRLTAGKEPASRCKGDAIDGAGMACQGLRCRPVAKSQRWTRMSLFPVATVVPSGEKAMLYTMPNWPRTDRSLLAARRIPESKAAVVAPRGKHFSVRRKRHGPYRAKIGCHGMDRLP